ncbi:MAG: mismatch-specific DNA-glycosylase [Gemmatimonadaceae bacterium]
MLARNLRLVVCGMAVGHRSERRQEYYAGRGNRFWRTLAEVGMTPQELAPFEFPRLLEYKIGLTDLAKEQVGNDHELGVGRADILSLRTKIVMYQPRYFCFNGKRAAQLFLHKARVEYGVQQERIGRAILFVAPSTSVAARGAWNLALWQDLASRVGRCSAAV